MTDWTGLATVAVVLIAAVVAARLVLGLLRRLAPLLVLAGIVAVAVMILT